MAINRPSACRGATVGFQITQDNKHFQIIRLDESGNWRTTTGEEFPIDEFPDAIRGFGEKTEVELVYEVLATDTDSDRLEDFHQFQRVVQSLRSSGR